MDHGKTLALPPAVGPDFSRTRNAFRHNAPGPHLEYKMNPRQPVDLARNLLVIVILSGLMIGSLYVLRPFLPGLIWATTIVVATWPVMLAVQRRCGNRRWIATVVMLIILLFVIVLPLYKAISTLALHGGEIMTAIKGLPSYALPPPPGWIHDVPLAGARIPREWQTLSHPGPGGLLADIEPYVTIAARWVLGHGAGLGVVLGHMLLPG